MPNNNSQFQGQTLIIPKAYYADDVAGGNNGVNLATPPLIFLGYGFGVRPQVPTTFNNAQDLLSAMRGGPCSGYVPFLTSPSNQLAGAQQITFINVGANTQSTYTASAGTSGVITFTSADYGLPSNQLQVSITAGTLAGKNVSLYDAYANVSVPPGVNLGVPFRMAYTGAATGVTMTVTVSGGVATTLATLGGAAGENITISLLPSNYSTVQGVVQYLNGTGFYSATVLSQGDLPSSNLDAATTVALPAPSGGGFNYVNVSATLGDIVWWCNHQANTLATAAVVTGITSSSGLAPTNIPFTLFTGATSTPPTTSNYASGFNVALAIPGWTVFADSNASGVVALGTQHANSASQPSVGRWRRFFTGSSIGDSIAATVSAAQSQNSKTTCYVYPGIYRTDTNTQVNTLYSGLYAAAAAAGMATGNPVATPLTNKALLGNGLEMNLTAAQIDQLQQAGVMCLYKSANSLPTVASDLTTWQSDNNPENVFTQQIACRWQLAYLLTAALQPYVGSIAAALTETQILNAAKNTLNNAIYSQANQNGVIADWDANSLQLVYNGTTQTTALQVSVQLVGQNRFITMLVDVQTFNTSVTANVFGQTGGLPV